MGFDLTGISPKSELGQCFRNSVWSWNRLWSFVCEHCSNILTPEQQENGFWNEGIKITGEQAVLIAGKLRESLEADAIDEDVKMPANIVKSELSWANFFSGATVYRGQRPIKENIARFIDFLESSGGFFIN